MSEADENESLLRERLLREEVALELESDELDSDDGLDGGGELRCCRGKRVLDGGFVSVSDEASDNLRWVFVLAWLSRLDEMFVITRAGGREGTAYLPVS